MAMAQVVPADLSLQNQSLDRGIYRASNSISLENTSVSTGVTVTLESAQDVVITGDFLAPLGSSLGIGTGASLATCMTTDVCLDDLPPTTGNNRFYSDLYSVVHPSFTFNGFDNEDLHPGGVTQFGYGLKQLVEEAFVARDAEVIAVLNRILFLAGSHTNECQPVYSRELNTQASQRLQAKAFIALMTYALERNGYDPAMLTPELPTAQESANRLQQALTCVNWFIETGGPGGSDDGVKWSNTVQNLARASDLYLAYENMYLHFDPDEYNNEQSTNLLTKTEKETFYAEYEDIIQKLEYLGGTKGEILGLDAYDVEPGNRPLKMQLGVALALLGMQDVGVDNLEEFTFLSWTQRGFSAAAKDAGSSHRKRYWGYQSGDGEVWWAEGPYYLNFALTDVIPFWHAVRINGFHENNKGGVAGFHIGNYLHNPDMINPLLYLAETAMPDGKTPAIDDGNKHILSAARLLNWSPAYGPSEVGDAFAWIQLQSGNVSAANDNLLPVQIAIPKANQPTANPMGEGLIAPPVYASNNFIHSDTVRQHILSRRIHAQGEYYTLLNGEAGRASGRGEGHEQADQLQLIYAVGPVTYLVDPGYDKPERTVFWERSSWNDYAKHNVMRMYPPYSLTGTGGVSPPKVDHGKQRVVSEHEDVKNFYAFQEGNVDHITGYIELRDSNLEGSEMYYGEYRRVVLVVNDPVDPYLIDFNFANEDDLENKYFQMRYNGNSDRVSAYNGAEAAYVWEDIYLSQENLNPQRTGSGLFIQPFAVEYDEVPVYLGDERNMRENFIPNLDKGEGVSMRPLLIGGDQRLNGFTTVSIIKALPQGTTPPPFARDSGSGDGSDFDYIVWPINANTIDVMASWSAGVFNGEIIKSDISFSVAEAGNFQLTLPETWTYGYVRLRNIGGTWQIDPDFQIYLQATGATSSPNTSSAIQSKSAAIPDIAAITGVRPAPDSLRRAARLPIGSRAGDELASRNSSVNSDKIPQTRAAGDGNFSDSIIPESNALEVFPNPASGVVTARLSLTEPSLVRVTLYDIQGKKVKEFLEKDMGSGVHQLNLDLTQLSAGTYIALARGDGVFLRRFITVY